MQISPMILLLAQWFNIAQSFCSSHTKSFVEITPPFFFLWVNTSRQWSVDWQDCSFLPSASICYSHLPQSLTRELSLGSVQIACLERYKNQIIVSSTVKSSRIFCQPKPAGDGSRQRAFSHTFCILQRLLADMPLYLNISCPYFISALTVYAYEGSEPQCLPSKWEHPVALSFP